MTELALPRLRIKRRRPPDKRKIYWALLFTTLLGFIAYDAIRVLRGSHFYMIPLATWVLLYWLDHKLYKMEKRQQAQNPDLPLPPISRFRLNMLGLTIVVEMLCWLSLVLGA